MSEKGSAWEGLWAEAMARVAASGEPAPDMPQENLQALLQELSVSRVALGMLRDELAGTRGQLEKSRDELRAIYENAPVMMCLLDRTRNIIYANHAFKAFTGVDDDQLVMSRACGVLGCINALDDPRGCGHGRNCADCNVRRAMEEVLATGESRRGIEYKTTLVRNGESDEVVMLASIARLSTGGAHNLLLCLEDITERTRAEEFARCQEERLRLAMEATSDGFWEWDVTSGNAVFSPRMYEMLGHTPDSLNADAATWAQLMHPDERSDAREKVRSFSRSGEEYYHSENRFLSKSGGWRWIMCRGRVVERTPQGGPLRLVGTSTDITERKLAEEALRESEELFKGLADSIGNVAVHSFSAEGIIRYWNQASEKVYGYTAEEALGKDIYALIIPEDVRDESRSALREWAKLGLPIPPLELLLQRKDGSPVPIMSSYAILRRPGCESEFFCMDMDLTEQKEAQAALRESEARRLESERRLLHAQKLESLGVLAGGIAHDFNNLLMAVLGNVELSMEMLSPLSPALDGLREAMNAARRAVDLTRQMLAYSGRGQFMLVHLDLNELVRENAHMLRAAISKNVTMNLQAGDALPPILADPGQLQQVVMNLITNASEAVGEKPGIVRLATGTMECDAAYLAKSRLAPPEPGRYVWLEVADTGCGMERETVERLFDPFFTTKFTGRGLGMSAVQGIIKGHRGAIMVDSTPERGSTIRVLFPAAHVEPAPKPQKASGTGREPAVFSGTVLVVDDEELVLKLGGSMLGRLGFSVLSATNGGEAVDIYREKGRDITAVLLDLTMPVMDGVATLRALREVNPEVRVILCSGFTKNEVTSRFPLEGLSGFLQKPYHLKALQAELGRVLGVAQV
ncbi:MAG: PAS domain S-box protein [Candidatus Hydrogenedens sp.]|nr:PAS domain S-box protein [Candidatus Hydrogenedens sp.]